MVNVAKDRNDEFREKIGPQAKTRENKSAFKLNNALKRERHHEP